MAQQHHNDRAWFRRYFPTFTMFEASFGILEYHRKLLRLCMKIMMLVRLWVMHKNLPLEPDIWISNTLYNAIGSNGIWCTSNKSTQKSIWLHVHQEFTATNVYRHADYLLGHVPPKYSPIYSYLVGTYSDANMDTATCVLTSYTTPITAAAARVCAPLLADYAGNPWAVVLWHG